MPEVGVPNWTLATANIQSQPEEITFFLDEEKGQVL